MSTVEILCIALLAFSAFCALVQAVKEVLLSKAQRPACPCRDLHSLTLTPGAAFELAPGTVIPPMSTSLRDLVLVDVGDDGSVEHGLGLNCSLTNRPTTLGWLIDDHDECRTKLAELMAFVTGGVLSKPGNCIGDVIGFARAAELNRLVEDHPDLVNSKPFVGMLKKELGDAEASSLIAHADMVAARRAGKANFQVAH
ncbi:hypothetical protein [Methylobacterium sp. WL7]|jgi:hypothetical protein|uniref:hypothetical protein n=1 Tax=Methylobacterium sp. WL7 TaxID=2603900 RepID=UPI0011CB27AD|nr:hypothetical protein [Methylobacterium sp. WL7]TXN47360.1 hypothetical protein FV233_04845 [Methylobacterium sp. WL7]